MLNKTYLIVGASSGIGKGVAEYLTTETGANVVLVARRYDVISEIADNLPGNNYAISCDVSVLENVAKIFEECEVQKIRIDGVVYAAGVAPLFSLEDNQRVEMINTMNVNALGFAEIANAMLNTNCINENCSVVAISSVVSQTVTNRQSAYAASKAMLNTYVQYFAREAIGRFRVNGILLGAVRTEMYNKLCEESNGLEDRMLKYYPLGIISVEKVSKLVKYLLSDDAEYMTGSLITMDSGYNVSK